MKILEINNLTVYFHIDEEILPSVDDLSLYLKKGEILALVGESGSGKSITALSIMGLIPSPGKIKEGEILFHGENLLHLKERQLQKIRGHKISMIYQDPMNSLNPYISIGDQIAESLIIHKKLSKKEARLEAIQILEKVGIHPGDQRYDHFPSQFSGGMRQRVMIGMAIACNPEVLIADEPTTALDVTVQAEILDLLKNLVAEYKMSLLLITHDLGLVAELADRVYVLYCGKIMEENHKMDLFKNPSNPYTKGLIRCIPKINDQSEYLYSIDGSVPHPTDFPKGCRFSPRCTQALPQCKESLPPLRQIHENQAVRCWLYGGAHETN